MHCLACTSPTYRFLDSGFRYLWDQYFGVPVEIFETAQDNWRGSIFDRIQKIQDDRILFVLTDYWLVRPVEQNRLRGALRLLETRAADKVDLTNQVHYFAHLDRAGYYEATQTAGYRQSTQAFCANRQFMLRYFGQGPDDPWQWETNSFSHNDGMKVCGYQDKIIDYANVMYKRGPDGFQLNRFSDEVLGELAQRGDLAGLMDIPTIRGHVQETRS